MTITVSAAVNGAPDHKLLCSSVDSPSGPVEHAVPGSLTFSIWKGHPVLLQEAGDPTDWRIVSAAEISPILGTLEQSEFNPAKQFKFDLKQVVIVPSGPNETRTGTVVGRGDYSNGAPDQFCVRHIDGHGNQVDNWYEEGDLRPF